MSLINKVTAYGTPGIIGAGALLIWGQTAIQWVTQPSHMLPVAAITAVGAITAAKRKGKVEEPQASTPAVEQSSVDDRIAQLAEELKRQALPPAQPTGPMVINHQGQAVERR